MADIFISYSSQDKDRIKFLVEAFKNQNWTVWWDRRIPPGKSYDQVIYEELTAAKCIVVIWSKHSIASQWVKEEAHEGKDRGILVPVSIDEVLIPFGFKIIQTAKLGEWNKTSHEEEFQVLFDAIDHIIKSHSSLTNNAVDQGTDTIIKKIVESRAEAENLNSTAPKDNSTNSQKEDNKDKSSNKSTNQKYTPDEEKNAEAQFNLGWKYAKGKGVTKNDVEAINWYRKAAEQGYDLAKDNLQKLQPHTENTVTTTNNSILEKEIINIISAFKNTDLYIAPNIPKNKLANATKSCKVPTGERIIALIDNTIFGSASECFLFGLNAVYYHNDWISYQSGAGTVLYKDFSRREFKLKTDDKSYVDLDNNQFYYANESIFSANELVRILTSIKDVLIKKKLF
jgi:hypothetical protein